jgi:hypothetical protein
MEPTDEMVEAACEAHYEEHPTPNRHANKCRRDNMRSAISAALAVAPKPKVKALAEDALNLCEAGHPISAANLARSILSALEDQS